MGHGATKRAQAMTLLLSGLTLRATAQKAGISERTLYNWLEDTDFCQELQTREAAIFDGAGRALLDASVEAVNILRTVANDDTQPGAVRVRAASATLDTMLRVVELRTLAQRIERIERLLDDDAGTR